MISPKNKEVIIMKYYVVDAFAEKVFEGNPAGVCIMKEWLSDETMQKSPLKIIFLKQHSL